MGRIRQDHSVAYVYFALARDLRAPNLFELG